MLWPFGFRYQSNLDGILDKKNITLEELLADDDYKNELKCGNEKLVNFLCLPSSLHKLIHLCLRMPPETASDTNKTEVPSLACDTLCRDHEDRVGRALLTDASYIQSILDTLILTAPLPPIMGFYLNRVLRSMIMNDAPSFFQKLQMLDPQTYVPLFLAHLTTSYVPDLIVTLQRGPPQSERINPQPLSNKPMSVSNDDWWLRGDFLKQSIYLLHNPRTSDSVRTTLLYILIEVVRNGMQFSDDSMVQNATKTPSPPAPSGSQREPSHTEPEHDCEQFTPPIVHHDRSLTDEFLKLDSVRAVVSRIDDEKGNDERVNAAMIDYFIALIETACNDQERAMGFVNQLSPLMGSGHDVGGFRGGSATPLLVRSTLRTQNNGHLEPDPQSRFEVSEEVSRTLYKLPPDGTPLEVVCEYLPKLIQLTVVGDSSPATRLRLPGLFIPVRAGAVRVRILSLLALLVTRRRRQCFDTILIQCETFRKCFDAFVAFHNNSFVHYSITEILLGTLQQKEEPMLRAQVLDMCELIVEYACQQYTSPQPRFQNFSYLIILCAELRSHVDPEVLKKHPHHATFLHDMIQQELNKQNTPLESEAKPLTLPNFTAPAPKPEEPSEVPFFRRYDSVENIAREMENLTTVSATSKSEMCNNSCTAISSDAEEDIISLDDLNEGVFASGGFRAGADTEHHSGPETHSLVVSAQEEPASGSVGCTHLQEFTMEKNEKLANSKQEALPNNEAKNDRDTCKPLGWSCSRVDMKEELLLDYNSFDYWKL